MMPKAVYGTQSPPRIDDLSIWVDPANKRCTKLDYSTLYPRYKVTGYTEIPNTITCLKSALTNENNHITYGFEARLGVVNSFTGKWHYSMGTGLDNPTDGSYFVNPGGRHQYYTTNTDAASFEHTTGNPNFYPYTSPGHFNFPYPLVLPDTDISSTVMAKKGINAMEDLYFERVDSMSSIFHPKIFSRQTESATTNGIPNNIDGSGKIEGEYYLKQLTASHGSLDKMITKSSRLEFPSHSIVSQNSAFMIKVRRFLSVNASNQNQDAPIEVRRGHFKHWDEWDVNGAFSYPNEHHINLEGQIINLSTFYNQDYGNSTTPNTFKYNEDRSQIGEIVEVGPIIDSDDQYFYHGIKSVNSQTEDGKNRTSWPEPTWAFDAYRNPVLPLELEDSLKQNPDQLDPAPARMFTLTYQGTVTEDHPEADGNTSGGEYDYHNQIADPGTFMFWHKNAKELNRYKHTGKIFLHQEGGSVGARQHGIFNPSSTATFNDNILLHKDDCDFNNPTNISWQANPRTLYVYKKSTGDLMLIVRRSQNNEHVFQNDLPAGALYATPNRDVQSTELTGFEAGEYNANNGDFRLWKLFRSAHGFNVGEEYVFVDIIDGYDSGPQQRRNFLISPIKHHQPDFYPGAFRFFGSKDDHTKNDNGKGIQFNKRIDNTNELEHFTMCQWVRTNWLKGQQVSPAFSLPVTGEDKIRWRYSDNATWDDEYGYPYHEKDHMPSTFSIGEQLMAFPSPYGISGWPAKRGLGKITNTFSGSQASVQSISPFLTDQQKLVVGAKTLLVFEQQNYNSTGENGIIFHSLYVSVYPTHGHNPMVRRNTSDGQTLTEDTANIAQKFTTLESVKENLPGFINDYVKDDGQAWMDITINQGEELKIIHIKSSDLKHGSMRIWKKGKEFAPNGQIYKDLVYYNPVDTEFSQSRLDAPNHHTTSAIQYHSMGAHVKERSDKFYISPGHNTAYTTLSEVNNFNKRVCGSVTVRALGGEDDLHSKAGCFCIQLGCRNGSDAPWGDFPVVVAQTYSNPSQNLSGSMPLWRHTSNKRIADNNWHHVAVTYSNSTTGTGECKIYIDGQLDATYTSDNYPNIGFPGGYSDAPHLRIGGVPEHFYEQTNDHPADPTVYTAGHRFDRSTVGFRGEIGPTHFYDDVALGPSEINKIYSSLKGRFIFND